MQILKMKPEFLEGFLESLHKFGTLFGPIWKDGIFTYDRIENIKDLVISGEPPMIPIKKLFHPKKFNMFYFNGDGFVQDCSMIEKRVVLGVHPCEVHGLLRLDDVFLKNPIDPYYARLRESTAIVGFSCLPADNSICRSTGTDIVTEGFDLFFVDLEEFYLVWVGSSLGHDMILEKETFFDQEVTHRDIQIYIEWREKRNGMFKRSFNFRSMPDIMELSYSSDIWEYFAKKCLACGQCTMVCPTCNCYAVTDIIDLASEISGKRERVWDSCMFVDYSLVAGEHNFRGDRADRLKLWYTHKLRAFGDEYGKPGCVGCGRCVDTCPVDINVLTVSEALTECEVPSA